MRASFSQDVCIVCRQEMMGRDAGCTKRRSLSTSAERDERVEHAEWERSGAQHSRWHSALAILYATRVWSYSVVTFSNLLGAVLALHLQRFEGAGGGGGGGEAQLDASKFDLPDGQRALADRVPETGANICWWTLFWTCVATVCTLGGCCLFDSYFDYVKGHDSPDGATDHTLVDRQVRPHQVVSAAVLLFVLAIPANAAAGMGERAPYWLGLSRRRPPRELQLHGAPRAQVPRTRRAAQRVLRRFARVALLVRSSGRRPACERIINLCNLYMNVLVTNRTRNLNQITRIRSIFSAG